MIIYKVTNKLNGKIYIGKTSKTLSQRRKEHYNLSRTNCNIKFHNALRKYDESNFEWEVYDKTTEQMASYLEVMYIDIFGSYDTGYNSTHGGEGISGFKHSDSTREKMKLSSHSERPWCRKKIVMYDYDTNEKLEEFLGMNESAKILGISRSSIWNNLRGLSKKVRRYKTRVYFRYS